MKPERVYSNRELEAMVENPIQDSLVRALAADLLNTRYRRDDFSGTLRAIVAADWREWKDDGLDSPSEFVLWSKSVARQSLRENQSE